MESVLDHCYVWHNFQAKSCSKKSSARAVLGLLEQKDVVAVLPMCFGKSLI